MCIGVGQGIAMIVERRLMKQNGEPTAWSRSRRASRDELRALQLERLQWSVAARLRQRRATTARSAEAEGVHPDDLRTLDDLAQVPVHDEADLRDGYPFGLFAVPREQVVRIHASSGTTGKPTVVGYTRRDIDTLGRPGGPLDPRRRRPARATSCTSPTATACSPAGSARTTAPSGSAAR